MARTNPMSWTDGGPYVHRPTGVPVPSTLTVIGMVYKKVPSKAIEHTVRTFFKGDCMILHVTYKVTFGPFSLNV